MGQKDDDAREEEEYRWDKMEVKGKKREVREVKQERKKKE